MTAVTFAGDADTVVTASMDRTIRVWSVKAVKEVKKDTKEPKEPKDKKDVKTPKGKKDVKGKKDETKPMEMIDPKDAGEIKRLGPTSDDPYAIAWDPKSKTLAVCGYSGLVTAWKLDDPKPMFTSAIKSPGYCIAFKSDGKAVLTGHDNGTIVVTPLGEK